MGKQKFTREGLEAFIESAEAYKQEEERGNVGDFIAFSKRMTKGDVEDTLVSLGMKKRADHPFLNNDFDAYAPAIISLAQRKLRDLLGSQE